MQVSVPALWTDSKSEVVLELAQHAACGLGQSSSFARLRFRPLAEEIWFGGGSQLRKADSSGCSELGCGDTPALPSCTCSEALPDLQQENLSLSITLFTQFSTLSGPPLQACSAIGSFSCSPSHEYSEPLVKVRNPPAVLCSILQWLGKRK